MEQADKKFGPADLFVDEVAMYDSTVEWVVPYYRQMHQMLVRLAVHAMRAHGDQTIMALDIGSGTGAEAIRVLRAIPHLRLIGVDYSDPMNAAFRDRAAKECIASERFCLIHGDILDAATPAMISRRASEALGTEGFQLVVSAFTLHHFTHEDKARVFQLVYELLDDGGVFLFGDIFNYDGESHWLSKTIFDWETSWFCNNFDEHAAKAGVSGESHKAEALRTLKEKWLRHYQDEHELEGVTTHLNMLKATGFSEVGNPFRYSQVGLICAKKGRAI